MTENDEINFQQILKATAASLGAEFTETMAIGYWMGLNDLSFEDFNRACMRAIRECKFFPKPVELRKMAGMISPETRAVTAWGAVAKAASGIGPYVSVDFDDPLINATIRNMGGWIDLCNKPSDDFKLWCRKDFERIYTALCESGTSSEACAPLTGMHELNNAPQGYECPPARRLNSGLPEHPAGLITGAAPNSERLRLILDKTSIEAIK